MTVLQNCMGFVEGGTGSCSETCVMCDVGGTEEMSIKVEEECDVDGTEEVSIKFEDAIDIKDEMPEAISFPPIKTEQEVRLWGLCEVLATHDFRPFITPLNKGNCEMTFIYSLLFVILCVHLSFEIWISILKEETFWKS